MPPVRSVLRALLAVVGVALMGFGVLTGASVWGSDAFPAGLALGFALLAFAAGGAILGAAALLSGHTLRPAQRTGLKLAGVLAVAAFVLPAVGVLVVPGVLFDWFGGSGFAVAIVGWFYLSATAFGVAVLVAIWRAAELAYGAFTT
ncbi:hypothetical protein [Halobacterium wangiae]|uniref:hypothetical protein n=1 Tax=Halobacterium wangiae TaxID=2902623 RepID=UPI001E5132D5|nr:hypothetical protein [Halobacterium wangiae]